MAKAIRKKYNPNKTDFRPRLYGVTPLTPISADELFLSHYQVHIPLLRIRLNIAERDDWLRLVFRLEWVKAMLSLIAEEERAREIINLGLSELYFMLQRRQYEKRWYMTEDQVPLIGEALEVGHMVRLVTTRLEQIAMFELVDRVLSKELHPILAPYVKGGKDILKTEQLVIVKNKSTQKQKPASSKFVYKKEAV